MECDCGGELKHTGVDSDGINVFNCKLCGHLCYNEHDL